MSNLFQPQQLTQGQLPQVAPESDAFLSMARNFLFNALNQSIPTSPVNFGGVQNAAGDLMGMMRNFGATGLNPFIESATEIARTGGFQDVLGDLDALRSLRFNRRADDMRAAAGARGGLASSGFNELIGRTGQEFDVQLAEQIINARNFANQMRLGGIQAGMAVPGLFAQMASSIPAFLAPLQAREQQFQLENRLFPAQLAGLASQFVRTLGGQDPTFGTSLFQDLAAAATAGAGFYNKKD